MEYWQYFGACISTTWQPQATEQWAGQEISELATFWTKIRNSRRFWPSISLHFQKWPYQFWIYDFSLLDSIRILNLRVSTKFSNNSLMTFDSWACYIDLLFRVHFFGNFEGGEHWPLSYFCHVTKSNFHLIHIMSFNFECSLNKLTFCHTASLQFSQLQTFCDLLHLT